MEDFQKKIAAGTRGPESDPKGAAGRAKAQLHHVSPAALVALGEVMRQGAAKYGDFNWATEKLKASTYFGAIMRHALQLWGGEDEDPESGVHHAAHLMACAMIWLEQYASGNLIDDRPRVAPFGPAAAEASEARRRFDAAHAGTAGVVDAGTAGVVDAGLTLLRPAAMFRYYVNSGGVRLDRREGVVDRRSGVHRRALSITVGDPPPYPVASSEKPAEF